MNQPKPEQKPVDANETTPAESLSDLALIGAHGNEVKGGQGTTVLAWARVNGVAPLSNHSENNTLADLPVRNDQQVKGGITKVGAGTLVLSGQNTYASSTTSNSAHGAGGGGGTGKVSVHDISLVI